MAVRTVAATFRTTFRRVDVRSVSDGPVSDPMRACCGVAPAPTPTPVPALAPVLDSCGSGITRLVLVAVDGLGCLAALCTAPHPLVTIVPADTALLASYLLAPAAFTPMRTAVASADTSVGDTTEASRISSESFRSTAVSTSMLPAHPASTTTLPSASNEADATSHLRTMSSATSVTSRSSCCMRVARWASLRGHDVTALCRCTRSTALMVDSMGVLSSGCCLFLAILARRTRCATPAVLCADASERMELMRAADDVAAVCGANYGCTRCQQCVPRLFRCSNTRCGYSTTPQRAGQAQ